MIKQGWYESDRNTMYFYLYGFSLPNAVNYLLNYVNMLHDGKKIVMLNANATPFLYKAQDNVVDNIKITEEKKQSEKVSEIEKDVTKLYINKGDKVENENE